MEPQTIIKVEPTVIRITQVQTENQGKRKYQKHQGPDDANRGHWTDEEKAKYIIFLGYHIDRFEVKEMRRAWKVFKAMSLFIGSRTADQCRSHHQKMEKNYNSCREIIAGFRVGIKPQVCLAVENYYAQRYLHDIEATEFRILRQAFWSYTHLGHPPQPQNNILKEQFDLRSLIPRQMEEPGWINPSQLMSFQNMLPPTLPSVLRILNEPPAETKQQAL